MSGLRIIIFVVGLIVAIPVIALNIWGINMSLWVNEVTARNEAVLQGETDIPEVRDMPAGPLDWFENRAELRDYFTTDKITDQRNIIYTETLDPEDLLRPGEAMPEDVFLPVYAAARAPARMIPYCAEILQTIGTACDVIDTKTRILSDGRAELVGTLAYIPAYPLGDPSQVADGDLARAFVDLPYEGDLKPANDAQARMAMMMQAQDNCDRLRTEFGNCVLGNLRFNVSELWITDLEVLPEGTNPQRVEAVARYVVYANPLDLNAQTLGDTLEAMVTAR